jgi:cytochrome c553
MRKPWYSFLFVRSPILKIIYGIVAVIISIAAISAQWWMESPRMAAQTGNWEGRSIEKGAEIFANNCASCHGADGKGCLGLRQPYIAAISSRSA